MKIEFLFPNWLWEWVSTFPPAQMKSITHLYTIILAFKVERIVREVWHRKVKLTHGGTKRKHELGLESHQALCCFGLCASLYVALLLQHLLKC